MSLYTVMLALHVITAVSGAGLLGAIPIAARSARRAGPSASSGATLEALLRYTRVSFFLLLATGAAIDFSVNGAFHGTGWFRASFALLVLVGFSHGRARAALKRGLAPTGDPEASLRSVERLGYAMCAAVALIVVLMEVKPLP
ncbi:Hypothetical protein A7982_04965 [Minicystis rosea]|nr:Hypothetical protein A7982_04965 [Minicystis rosea]